MKNISTRLLMSCAAIGVAGGVLFAVNAWLGGTVANLVPVAYGATIGVYFIPGALAQALFRRPWVGLLTSAVSGLVAVPLQAIGFGALAIALVIGLLQELPFLVTRYRRWRWWLFAAGGLFSGLITTGGAFRLLGAEDFGPIGVTVLVAAFLLSPLAGTLLGVALAAPLERAGIGRGVRAEGQPHVGDPT